MKDGVGSKILAKGDQIPEKLGLWDSGSWAGPWRGLIVQATSSCSTTEPGAKPRSWQQRWGEEPAEIPKEVASSSVIFTMLPGPPEVEEVVAGEDGLLEEPGKESLIIDMSTSSPVLARELAGRPQAGSRDARRPGEQGRRGG